MTFDVKKKFLSAVSILNTACAIFILCIDFIEPTLSVMLLDFFAVMMAFLPYIYIRSAKKMKHLFWVILPFALSGFLSTSLTGFILSAIGLVVSFITTKEEDGALGRLIRKYPISFSIIVILAGMTFLSTSSVLDFFSELIYGFDMLGELIATLFLFFMIIACGKQHLIFKNRGSIQDSLLVSMPFIIFIFYLGSSLLANHIVEGYSLYSLDNIIAVSLFYIFVGIFEDFLIRGLSLNILLDKFGKTKKGVWLSVFLSSLFFGLVHFTNLMTGASFTGVLIQVISATCIGMYFAAVYLRSGNVWTPAFLHGFYDLAVSVSAFFIVNDVVDTTEQYAESISNYSWANLIIAAIYVLITIYLLRSNKLKNAINMINGKKTDEIKGGKIVTIVVGFAMCGIVSFMMFSSFFQINDLTRDLYNKILTNTDYYEDYEMIYINDFVNYNSLSDESKMLIAINNLEDSDFVDSYSITKAEEVVLDDAIFTYIEKDKINESLEEIFGEVESVNYVSVNVSYKTTCEYDKDISRYICITTNNSQSNELKVYSNISSIKVADSGDIEVYVYYLVEDLENHVLYADSNLNTVFKYNTLVDDLTDGISYIDDDKSNKDFWKNIEKNSNGKVPTYKLIFELDETGLAMNFVSSEFLTDSIDDSTEVKEELIENDLYLYNASNYTFTYNKAHYDVVEDSNKLSIKKDDITCLEITTLASDEWLVKYKTFDFVGIILGNYTYYNYGNEYLIYKNDFYIISINAVTIEEKTELIKIISSIEFK